MRIYPLKVTGLTKLVHIKPGQLVTLYDEHLQPGSTYITCNIPGTLFDPENGTVININTSSQVKPHRGAAIVIDYSEGA